MRNRMRNRTRNILTIAPILTLLTAFSTGSAHAGQIAAACSDIKSIALEMLEWEFSGRRWLFPKDCVHNKSFRYVKAVHAPVQEFAGPQSTYALSSSSPASQLVTNLKVTPSPEAGIYLITYTIPSLKISDQFTLMINEGRERDLGGCAGFLSDPKNMVLRPQCVDHFYIQRAGEKATSGRNSQSLRQDSDKQPPTPASPSTNDESTSHL